SAGGLESLERVFSELPEEPGLAFVIVQHLSPDFRSLMDEILGRQTSMPVRLSKDGERIEPNHVYLLPPGKEMTIEGGRLRLHEKTPDKKLAFPIDRFFESLAADAGTRAVAVVLSGTGSDGSRGIRTVKEHGGTVLVERPDTAKFDGMPLTAAATGSADRVLAATEVGQYLRMLGADEQGRYGRDGDRSVGVLQSILWLLHERTGIDFSLYKTTTVARRVDRRTSLCGLDSPEKYLERLRSDADELDALYCDLLIGVTEFFRDPDVFDAIEKQILPEILSSVATDRELRLWVAGCATGEEAYSLAILIVEACERLQRPVKAKIMATDIHQGSLAVASAGIYPPERIEKLSDDRRQRFFDKVPAGYRVRNSLRKLVIFAHHDLTRDAPFTRMHMITCRNMLIYLEQPAQRTVLSLLHFGLLVDGVLVLGLSETPDALIDEFTSIDERLRLFRKLRDVRLTESVEVLRVRSAGAPAEIRPLAKVNAADKSSLISVYDRLLDRYMPPSLLIESNYALVDVFAGAEQFLTVPKRRPSQNVLEMLPPEIASAVSAAVHHTISNRDEFRSTRVRLERDEQAQLIRLSVRPVPISHDSREHLLITLEPEGASETEATGHSAATRSGDDLSKQHVATLEGELAYTQEMLQATVEELQTSNEELQSTNEELVASNEELQSTNEELHSINEELYTVNAEHQKRLAELHESNSDMRHLLDGTEVGILFLDDRLHIRRLTSRITPVFRITDKDVGRALNDFAPNLQRPGLMRDIEKVLHGGESIEEEVRGQGGETYYLRVLPYRPRSARAPGDDVDSDAEPPSIGGVVITTTDITGLVNARSDVARLIAIVESSSDSIIGKDLNGTITSWNKGAEKLYGYRAEEAIGQSILMLFPDDQEHEFQEIMAKLQRGDRIERFETMRCTKDKRFVEVEVTISPILDPNGEIVGASSIARDVSSLKRAQRESEARQQRISLLLNSTAEAIYGIDNDGYCTFANPSCARMLGYDSPQQLIGQNIHQLIHHTRPDGSTYPIEECRIYRAFQQNSNTHVDDEVFWRADGTSFEAEYWSHPIRDGGEVSGAVVTFLDITERRQAEREMEQEAQQRERFLAMLSHELRNPLAAVLNAVHWMNAVEGPGADESTQAREIIDRQCRHMARLLDDLLDVSRIARGKIELRAEVIDLRDIVRQAIESTTPLLRSAGISLLQEIPPRPVPCLGDAARLQQVCVNLLSNAARYSDAGTQVTLALEADDEQARIAVQDEGEGIDEDLLPHVFELFVQGQRDIDRTEGGLGVGLALAKDLVARHGGNIEARSDGRGKGSTFVVHLPLAEKVDLIAAREEKQSQNVEASRGDLRIVLVEDQADARTALRQLLELQGYDVVEAADGRSGASIIEAQRPDVAIVDIGLPELDGYEVARQIRSNVELESVYLVAMTGYGTSADISRARDAGFNEHLTKPTDHRRLQEIFANIRSQAST
ncbi:MAG: PAS domain S-box protein, partial [Woeseia sp.]|nr:PAS domain S-box protein [Woeseia sp.]